MKREIVIDGNTHTLEWSRTGDRFEYQFDSEPSGAAQVILVEPDTYLVLSGGSSYEVRVEPACGELAVTVRGRRYPVEVRDPRQWRGTTSATAGRGPQRIVSPMPGKIVRLLVKPGDTVEAGQGVAVVEAMKMQNEMKATRGGLVAAVSVAEGETVPAGEVLVTIE